MLNNKKLVMILVLSIFLIGCSNTEEKINVSELIEKGKVDIAGHSFDLFYETAITYKYDDENLVEKSDENQKIKFYYDDNILIKNEVYASSSYKLFATSNYTYDSDEKVIRKDTVMDQTKDKLYQITSYDKNYKETRYYDKNDELTLIGEIELNDKQQMIKFTSKSKEGTVESVSHYKYEDDNLVFRQSTGDNGVIREVYYKYNEYGDQVAVIAITFIGRKSLDAMYYNNEYEGLKLVKQIGYKVYAELDEEEINDIVKSLK